MIGQVEFVALVLGGDQPAQTPLLAVLQDDGTWTCALSEIRDVLQAFYSPNRHASPCRGPFGSQQLQAAATLLQGTVQWPAAGAPVLDESGARERIF